jgi:protein-arginine kinase activator protein McsA
MRCDQCQEREAIVHITSIVTPAGGTAQYDYCEPCFLKRAPKLRGETVGWVATFSESSGANGKSSKKLTPS